MVLTYSSQLPNIHNILHRNMYILKKSERMVDIYKNTSLVAFKRKKNLGDTLIHQKYHQQFFSKESGSSLCGKDCALCKRLIPTCVIPGKNGGSAIKSHINCQTYNVIYGIYCNECDQIIYVGETGTPLYTRIQNHLSHIRNGHNEDLNEHFSHNNHSIDNLKIVGIEKARINTVVYRRIRELHWIRQLNTLKPIGLNKKQ